MKKVIFTKKELALLDKKYPVVKYEDGYYIVEPSRTEKLNRKVSQDEALRFNLVTKAGIKTIVITDFVKKVLYPQKRYQDIVSIYELQSICNFIECKGMNIGVLEFQDKLYEEVRKNIYDN